MVQGIPARPASCTNLSAVSNLDTEFRAQALQGWPKSSNSPSPARQNGFTLSEEARNTETHGLGFAFSTPLRGKGISFVSAGNLKMEDEPAREVHTQGEPEQAQETIDKPITSVQE